MHQLRVRNGSTLDTAREYLQSERADAQSNAGGGYRVH